MLYAVVKLCGQKYIVSPHCVHLCLIFFMCDGMFSPGLVDK